MSIESPWTGRADEPVDQVDDQPFEVDDTVPDDAGHDDAEQALPEPPMTGDDAVDRAVAEVAHAVVRPLEDQVAVIDAAHRTLQDRLADVEG